MLTILLGTTITFFGVFPSIHLAEFGFANAIFSTKPTGALDSKTGRTVMDLFHELNRNQGKTIVLITHSTGLAEETDRIITISDGTITGERAGSWNL